MNQNYRGISKTRYFLVDIDTIRYIDIELDILMFRYIESSLLDFRRPVAKQLLCNKILMSKTINRT